MLSNSNSKLNSIQVLRAFAVLLVVYTHILDRQPSQTESGSCLQQHFFYLRDFGAVGVDIFFVISGFIITVIAQKYAVNKEWLYFFLKRVIRVVPLYWITSLLFLVRNLLRLNILPAPEVLKKTLLFFPFSDNNSFVLPVLFQGWTLSFELLFYLIITLAMAVSSKRYMLLATLVFLFSILFQYLFSLQGEMFIFLGNGILLEFLMGTLIGYFFLSSRKCIPFIANLILVAGIAGLLLSLFFGYGNISEVGYVFDGSHPLVRVFRWGFPSALLVAGFVGREKNKPGHYSGMLIGIGNASYSIYLIHILIIHFIYLKWEHWNLQHKIQPDWLVLISLVLVITGGYLFYKLVEIPLLHLLNRILNNQKWRRERLKNKNEV